MQLKFPSDAPTDEPQTPAPTARQEVPDPMTPVDDDNAINYNQFMFDTITWCAPVVQSQLATPAAAVLNFRCDHTFTRANRQIVTPKAPHAMLACVSVQGQQSQECPGKLSLLG